MKTTKFYIVIVSLVALLASNAIAAAWTGSMSEPENMKKIDGKSFYVITTADELAWFADQVNGGKSTINAVLGNDIVFGKDKNTTSTVQWTPIGKDESHKFSGIFDGANYSIYGIFSTGLHFAGVFGFLNTNGAIQKLKTSSGYIKGHFRVGGIVAHSSGLIQNVENNNKVVGSRKDSSSVFAGGITARNLGSIVNSSNRASISDTASDVHLGGLVGYNNGNIVNSGNSGSVDAKAYSSGSDGVYSGGIAGYNIGSINRTRNIGAISANGSYSYSTGSSGASNNNCSYEGFDSMGIIHYSCTGYRKTYVGGIVGFGTSTISNGINNGTVKITSSKKTNAYSNGIIASGKAKNSIDLQTLKYWLNETEVQGTAENMQKDQFAWILNTTNGTETNSGVWTRTTGYPDFAKDSNLPIYRVVFNDDGATSNRYTNYKGLATFPENPEPAEGLVFMGWYNSENVRVKPATVFSSDQTVNVVYMNATDIYWTINFFNTDVNSTLLETKQYQHGSTVAYEGETPTKETTAKYTYTFKGWNVEPTNAVEDFDYYAVYDSTIRSYTITFKDYDGSEISSSAFEYGIIPTCSKTPSRNATAEWTYTHKGWKPALDYVTEATAYTATYDSTKVEYKVTFMNGVDVIDEQMVPYGDAAVAPTNVTREGYRFIGWNTSFSKVTENLTVKALFEELVTYIVKVLDGDGTKIDSVKIVEGESYTLPIAPQKDGYTFDAYYNGKTMLGVVGEVIPVTANITITAIYTKDPESSSSSVVKSSSSSAKSSSSSIPKSSSSIKSSSSAKSSSSQAKSSSSEKTNAVVSMVKATLFSIHIQNRSIHISAAPLGSAYAIFDMQGRILKKGRVESVNFNIPVMLAGNYVIKIGHITQHVQIK